MSQIECCIPMLVKVGKKTSFEFPKSGPDAESFM